MKTITSVLILLFATSIQADTTVAESVIAPHVDTTQSIDWIGNTKWSATLETETKSSKYYGHLSTSVPILNDLLNIDWSGKWEIAPTVGGLQNFDSHKLGVSKKLANGLELYVDNTLTKKLKRTETFVGLTFSW